MPKNHNFKILPVLILLKKKNVDLMNTYGEQAAVVNFCMARQRSTSTKISYMITDDIKKLKTTAAYRQKVNTTHINSKYKCSKLGHKPACSSMVYNICTSMFI